LNEAAAEPSTAPLDLSVVVPCYNEELNIPELVERTLRTFDVGKIRGELVLVDDGSRDKTAEVIRAHAALFPGRVVGVFHDKNRGLAAAWRSGVEAARGLKVSVIDADLQYQPEDILRLYRTLMESSVDIVQGWRSSVGRLRDGRYVLSRGLNTILNRTFGMNLKDNKSGFICCAKEVMQDLLRYKGRYAYWQSFIMVAAHARGYSYREIETLFTERKQGTSFLDGHAYRASAKNLLDVGSAFWEYRLNPPASVLDQGRVARPAAGAEQSADQDRALRLRLHLSSLASSRGARPRHMEWLYESLKQTQWLSPQEIRELQSEKLRRLIRHAYRNVPYYRAGMREAGIGPEDVRDIDDLAKLPLLGKQDIRAHLHFDIMQEGVSHADLRRVTTAGSTGEPLVCYIDRAQRDFRWAAGLRAQEWTGYRFGDPWVKLSSTPPGDDVSELRNRIENKLSGCTVVPVLQLTPAKLDEIAGLLAKRSPVLLDGDAEVLALLAEHVLARGGLGASCRGVVSTGQTLSARSRALFESAFGCPVFDAYGCREFSRLAHESNSHAGHLIAAEGYVLEVLIEGRPARPGEIGEVVITDLNGFAMPLIRYRVGDVVQAIDPREVSPCGRGLPRLREIHGRAESILRGADGQLVPGTFLTHAVAEFGFALKRVQAVQREPGSLELRIVKGARYSDDRLQELMAILRAQLGDSLKIEVAFDDDEPMAPSRRAMVSGPPIDLQRQGLRIAR
jgi:phenylacetate-CoA ligase